MKVDLVGYVCKTLEPDERAAVERHLEHSAEARRQLELLKQGVTPLEIEKEELTPPVNLVLDTLKRVASSHCRKGKPAAARCPTAVTIPSCRTGGRSRWRMADFVVAASILLVLFALIPPAVQKVRHHAQVTECASNLSRFHQALTQFAVDRGDGYLPRPGERGPTAAAGIWAPTLREGGYWSDDMRVVCPANVRGKAPAPPTLSEVIQHADAADFEYMRRKMGGCYGYNIGYEFDDETGKHYVAVHRRLGDFTPILADRPKRPHETDGPDWQIANSPNHGFRGQNVLYLGGHVRFEATRIIGDDDIFLNTRHKFGVGNSARDHVLLPSEAPPYPVD